MSNKTFEVGMVNPFDRSISKVDLSADKHGSILGRAKELMDCGTIDIVTLTEKHMAIVDDEGLLNEDNKYSKLADYHQPLAGIVLVMGYDADGDNADIDPEYFEDLVKTTRFMNEGFSVEPRFEFVTF